MLWTIGLVPVTIVDGAAQPQADGR